MTAMGQDYSDLYTEKRRFTTYGWEETCAGCRGGGRKVRTRLAWIASFHRGSSVVAWLCLSSLCAVVWLAYCFRARSIATAAHVLQSPEFQ